MNRMSLFSWGLGAVIGFLGCGSQEAPEPPRATDPDPGVGDAGGGGLNAACAPLGEAIVVSAQDSGAPSILWTAGGYLVAWQARTGGADEVRVARVGTDGKVASAHVVATLAGTHAVPSLHTTSSGILVTWEDAAAVGLTIHARTLDGDGQPTGPAMQLGTSDATEARPAAAPLSGGLAVAWMETPGARLGLVSGQGMGSVTSVPGARFPALASRGNELAVAWSQGSELSLARTTGMPGGSLAGVTVRTGFGEARLPSLAFDGSGAALVAWEDTREAEERIYLAHIGANGTNPGEVRVEDADGSANWPGVAVMGDRTAVVFYQFQGGPSSIYLAVFGPGLAREGDVMRVSGKNARFPAVTFTGSELGVAWAEKDAGIRLRRLACD